MELSKSVPYKDTKFMGGRWRYKLTESWKLAKAVSDKDTKFMGGRSRYKLTESLKLAKSAPYNDSKVSRAQRSAICYDCYDSTFAARVVERT